MMNKSTWLQARGAADERGMALLAVLMVVFLLALLGMTSMQLAGQEMAGASALQQERVPIMRRKRLWMWRWDGFTIPLSCRKESIRHGSQAGHECTRRSVLFRSAGTFTVCGNGESSRRVFDAANPQHDRLLNDPQTGWFKSLNGLARILKLRVYGPTRPGLLCTIEVTAGAGQVSRVSKTLSIELGTYAIPALHAPLQSGTLGSESVQSRSGSILVHWGDMKVRGQAYFPRPDEASDQERVGGGDGASLW